MQLCSASREYPRNNVPNVQLAWNSTSSTHPVQRAAITQRSTKPATTLNVKLSQASFLVQSTFFFFSPFQSRISIPKLMLLLTCEPWQKEKWYHWTLKSFLSEKNLQSGHMSVNWKLPLLSSVQTSLAGWLPQWRNKSVWIWPCEV